MKKILFIFALILSFSVASNAQTEKKMISQDKNFRENPKVAAKALVSDMSQIIEMDGTMQENIVKLFEHKYRELEKLKTDDTTQISELSKIIDMKLQATFNAEEIKKLKAVSGLYEKLIN